MQKDTSPRELDTILRFGSLINSSLNIEDVLDHAMKWAEEFMDAEASSVYELNRERNEIFIRLARGEKREPIRGIRLKVGDGIAGWVVKTGRPVVSQDGVIVSHQHGYLRGRLERMCRRKGRDEQEP